MSGCAANNHSRRRAGPLGAFLPCSHACTVWRETLRTDAKTFWLKCSLSCLKLAICSPLSDGGACGRRTVRRVSFRPVSKEPITSSRPARIPSKYEFLVLFFIFTPAMPKQHVQNSHKSYYSIAYYLIVQMSSGTAVESVTKRHPERACIFDHGSYHAASLLFSVLSFYVR
jgi:hypothetical protein